MGVYILRPHAAGILYAPPFYTPPTPRRVFSGVGGGACIKFGPVPKSAPLCSVVHLLGSVFGRRDSSRIFIFESHNFFADFIASFLWGNFKMPRKILQDNPR